MNVAISRKNLSGIIFEKKNARKGNERKSSELTNHTNLELDKNEKEI